MSVQYELWLTDDAGRRMALLEGLIYLSYTRATQQFGTLQMGMPFEPFAAQFVPWFRPDWRVEVWRSPGYGILMRREDVFLLRKPNVYSRAQDGMQVIQFYGRNGLDLLKRRHVIQRAGSSFSTKTDYADDMMKDFVREQMLYGSAVDENETLDNTRAWPQGEFSVQGDASAGPSVTAAMEGKNVLQALKDIRNMTFQKYRDDPSNNERIWFDVLPQAISDAPSGSPLGWMFVTRAGMYGMDRTDGVEFSEQNENIKSPSYSISHLEEVNTVYVNGGGRGNTQIIERVTDAARVVASRWNRAEGVISSSNETSTTGLQDAGAAELEKGRPQEDLPLVFLNTPGGKDTPRSLYGVDWDLGDRLRVNYARKQFEAEVNIVYVAVDENGQETVTGRNEVQNV